MPREQLSFRRNEVRIGEQSMSFAELVKLAYLNRVQLSATGFYRTPKVWYDQRARTRPALLLFRLWGRRV